MASRRSFLCKLGMASVAAVLAATASARAQPAGRVPRIGFLANTVPLAELEQGTSSHPAVVEFLAGLRKLGWQDGRNVNIVWKSAEGRYDRLPKLAEKLVLMEVDVIVAFGGGVTAAARATKSVPIVMGTFYSPVESGLARSMSRPGSNVTGTTLRAGEREQHNLKRLALLKEAAPHASRIAFVTYWHGDEGERKLFEARWLEGFLRDAAVATAMRKLDMELFAVTFGQASGLAATIQEAVRRGAQGLWFGDVPDFQYPEHQRVIAEEARRHRLPAIHQVLSAAEHGALMAYGADVIVNYRRVPYFVDRILRGAKPGDIPIEDPAKVEFHVNLTAAKAIGLEIPPPVLLQADRVFR